MGEVLFNLFVVRLSLLRVGLGRTTCATARRDSRGRGGIVGADERERTIVRIKVNPREGS
jgi:hypothetical protein